MTAAASCWNYSYCSILEFERVLQTVYIPLHHHTISSVSLSLQVQSHELPLPSSSLHNTPFSGWICIALILWCLLTFGKLDDRWCKLPGTDGQRKDGETYAAVITYPLISTAHLPASQGYWWDWALWPSKGSGVNVGWVASSPSDLNTSIPRLSHQVQRVKGEILFNFPCVER